MGKTSRADRVARARGLDRESAKTQLEKIADQADQKKPTDTHVAGLLKSALAESKTPSERASLLQTALSINQNNEKIGRVFSEYNELAKGVTKHAPQPLDRPKPVTRSLVEPEAIRHQTADGKAREEQRALAAEKKENAKQRAESSPLFSEAAFAIRNPMEPKKAGEVQESGVLKRALSALIKGASATKVWPTTAVGRKNVRSRSRTD